MAAAALQASASGSMIASSRSRGVQRPAAGLQTQALGSSRPAVRAFGGGALARRPQPGLACPRGPAPAQPLLLQTQQLLLQQGQAQRVLCRGLFGLGLPEIAVIAGVAALIFGPSKLPELGKGLGKTVKSFQTAAKEFKTELEQAAAADDEPGAKQGEGEAKPPKSE